MRARSEAVAALLADPAAQLRLNPAMGRARRRALTWDRTTVLFENAMAEVTAGHP
jgi:hypothetical protein